MPVEITFLHCHSLITICFNYTLTVLAPLTIPLYMTRSPSKRSLSFVGTLLSHGSDLLGFTLDSSIGICSEPFHSMAKQSRVAAVKKRSCLNAAISLRCSKIR